MSTVAFEFLLYIKKFTQVTLTDKSEKSARRMRWLRMTSNQYNRDPCVLIISIFFNRGGGFFFKNLNVFEILKESQPFNTYKLVNEGSPAKVSLLRAVMLFVLRISLNFFFNMGVMRGVE